MHSIRVRGVTLISLKIGRTNNLEVVRGKTTKGLMCILYITDMKGLMCILYITGTKGLICIIYITGMKGAWLSKVRIIYIAIYI